MMFWLIFFSTVAIDQLTKWWAVRSCAEERAVTAWFSCELSYNRGVSWSLLHGDDSLTFMAVSALIVCVIIFFAHYTYQLYKSGESLLGPALILGGAIGNMIDRCVHGGVVDFIYLHYGTWSWPIFNIADIAICLGVFLLVGTHYGPLD